MAGGREVNAVERGNVANDEKARNRCKLVFIMYGTLFLENEGRNESGVVCVGTGMCAGILCLSV